MQYVDKLIYQQLSHYQMQDMESKQPPRINYDILNRLQYMEQNIVQHC